MAAITSAMVKELRERTSAGMMDCKKALMASDGDMEKAIEWLREKGLSQAAKKASRIAAEGVVAQYTAPCGCTGVIVEVNCETDFVAKTDNFKSFADNVAKHIAKADPADVDALLAQKFVDDESKTIADLISDATVAIGEKISVRRFARYQTSGVVSTYIHMGGKVGVLVEVACDEAHKDNEAVKTFAHDLALQIAAAKPEAVRREEVDASKLEKEKEILRAQAINEGKPEKIVDRMVEGRVEKYYKDNCLVDQLFVKDPNMTIAQYVTQRVQMTGENIKIRRFVRYEMGEGLEKRHDNFAEEVAAQTKKA